jgi:kynurenine formamidase
MNDYSTPTPQKYGAPAKFGEANVIRGLRAATTGEVISLNLPLDDENVPLGRSGFKRTMRLHNHVRPVMTGQNVVINDDEVSFALQGSSQWDALAHVGLATDSGTGVYHGGAGLEETYPQASAPRLGIQALGPAVVTRGVLLDLVAHFSQEDVGYLDADVRIGRTAVEECIERQQETILPGDAVLIYTGFERRRSAFEGKYPSGTAGLDGTTVPLWAELDIFALIADNVAVEATPPDYSVHLGVLRDLGIPLGELWALDRLAMSCRSDARYEFLLVSVPLNIDGAFGSTANAVAIR